jgi:hypothetical protein
MPTVDTQLVDTDVDYCAPEDVFAHIRNKQYADLPADANAASGGALTQAQVDRIISAKSEKADNFTKRAWRTRKVVDVELRMRLDHKQGRGRHRRRRRQGRGSHHNPQSGGRGFVDLPHTHIKPVDSAQGDTVVILNPRSTDDITDDEGRSDGSYVVDNRKGVLRPDIRNISTVGTHRGGANLEDGDAKVRVSYRYGFPKDVTAYDSDGDGVSDHVPEDVRDAVALLAAAQIVGSDQYGEMVPSGSDDSPSLSDASSAWESRAMDTLKDFRRV